MDFSHIDKDQRPTMVDVSAKAATERSATAECFVFLGKDIMHAFTGAWIENNHCGCADPANLGHATH